MLQQGDHIIHNTFGKGEVIDIAVYDDDVYLEIQFQRDKKGHTRMFTLDSLKPHMI